MGIGAHDLDDAGAVTAPTDALVLALGSADSTTWAQGLPIHPVNVPFHPAVALMNGVDPVRIHIEGTTYRLGGLPIGTAPTATPSGSRGTATLDLDDAGNGGSVTNPPDGSYFILGQAVYIRAILSSSPAW